MLESVNLQAMPAQALMQQGAELLRPLVRLMLANGVTYPQLAHVLKDVFIDEARRELLTQGRKDTDSALTLLTGVHRKEIKQRGQALQPSLPDLSLASQVFTRWLTDPQYRDLSGAPLALQRTGEAPSFDTLARPISKDLHPRTILDELLRLGLVQQQDELLTLNGSAFVPQSGFAERLSMLVANVADHLGAGAHNLMQPTAPMLEQAVFADHLHPASVELLLQRARDLWQQDFQSMVDEATRLCASDEPRGGRQRVRYGVYFFTQPMNDSADAGWAPAATEGKESA